MLTRVIKSLGKGAIANLAVFGAAWIFLFQSFRSLFHNRFRVYLLLQQIKQIGADSTWVIMLIGVFTGAVLAVQAEYSLSKFGASGFTGSAIALSLIRELGPVLTALMVIGRAGSAITAELGIMKITEQIDALRSMAVDPLNYLIVPRILAGIIVMPLLTAIFIVVGIGGGYLIAVRLIGLSSGMFMSEMVSAVDMTDIYSGLIKGIVFGLIFGWVSCFKGMTSGFGAIGVNRATTQSVVVGSVGVLIVDYFLTSILTRYFF